MYHFSPESDSDAPKVQPSCSVALVPMYYTGEMKARVCPGEQGRRQPQKSGGGGGPNHVSLLVSSKSYNIHTWGTPPPYVIKTFQRICANPKRGLNRSGGSGPLHSPLWRRHSWGVIENL